MSPEFMSSLSLQALIESLRNLGVNPGDCIVRNRKGEKEVVYEGVPNIISDISEAPRKTIKYKVELERGLYDGDVQCIIDEGKITAVEITGSGTMHYKNDNIYTGTFLRGFRHGKGTMEFFNIKRTYTGEWQLDIPEKTGVLHFKGLACNYEGELQDMYMHGKGIFKSQSPFYTFLGVFQRDIPVSGALEENKTLGPKTMKTIEAVPIFQQKPNELDADTIKKYERELEEQTEKDREGMKPYRPRQSNSPPRTYWSDYID